MAEMLFDLTGSGEQRGNWVRLRTLILLRWIAIAGQIIALLVATYYFNFQIELGLFFLIVGTSVIANFVAIFVFPENKRLREGETFMMVLFDLLQISALLFLTGGLNNPFALMIIGPVTISAATLTLRSTVLLGSLAIVFVSLLSAFYMPLRTNIGATYGLPDIFVFGSWVAIVITVVFMSIYARWITSEVHSMSDALQATQMALFREQKLTDIGGVVAAAAHELGTPLATIKLTSSELVDDLSDMPDLAEDAQLINQEADRCRDILRSMGQAGKDDLYMRKAPLTTVIEEAANPHIDRGIQIHFGCVESRAQFHAKDQPTILRRPEIIHGLRNMIQNAVDFANDNVWIDCAWAEDTVSVRIQDDGPGFPTQVMGRIGDPFMRNRKTPSEKTSRPGYEGMGLGLFIAKTLLERTGAELTFANSTGDSGHIHAGRGAVVVVTWPLSKLDALQGETPIPNAPNQPFEF